MEVLSAAEATVEGTDRSGAQVASVVWFQDPVNWGLSQFDRAVDDNNLGAENDRLISLFQDDKSPPYITPGNRKRRKVKRDGKSLWVPWSSRLPGSGLLIMWTGSNGRWCRYHLPLSLVHCLVIKRILHKIGSQPTEPHSVVFSPPEHNEYITPTEKRVKSQAAVSWARSTRRSWVSEQSLNRQWLLTRVGILPI